MPRPCASCSTIRRAGSAGRPRVAASRGAVADWLAECDFASGTLYHGALAVLERPLFEHALARTGGNQVRAAQMLGINRNTLRKRLDDLAIDPERFAGLG